MIKKVAEFRQERFHYCAQLGDCAEVCLDPSKYVEVPHLFVFSQNFDAGREQQLSVCAVICL